MKLTLTIAKRELMSLFCSPIAYLVLGVFSLGTAMIFSGSFGPGAEARLGMTLDMVVWLMIFLVPAISMRLLSEELKAGTIETLMTTPLTDTQVVVGKWLGAMGFFAALLLPLVVLMVVLECVADPDYGPMVTGIVGLLFVGGLYMAIGTLGSAITESQIIAFVVSVFLICILTIGMYMIVQAAWVWPWLRNVLMYMNVNMQFSAFSRGLITLSNFIYFISGIVMFLFVAVKLLESRRWR